MTSGQIAERNNFSGVQSYCPSYLKYGKNGYTSLYHPGKGAQTIKADDIQIQGLGDLNSKDGGVLGEN